MGVTREATKAEVWKDWVDCVVLLAKGPKRMPSYIVDSNGDPACRFYASPAGCMLDGNHRKAADGKWYELAGPPRGSGVKCKYNHSDMIYSTCRKCHGHNRLIGGLGLPITLDIDNSPWG